MILHELVSSWQREPHPGIKLAIESLHLLNPASITCRRRLPPAVTNSSAPMAPTARACLLIPRTPPLLSLLARLPTRNPTTPHQIQYQFKQLRHASKKTSRATTKKKVIPPAPVVKRAPQLPPLSQELKYVPLVESLGNSGREKIILYTSNNRLFIVSCYGLATGMVAWSVYTWNTNITNRSPEIPRWATSSTYVSVTVMLLLAGVVSYYPTRCGFHPTVYHSILSRDFNDPRRRIESSKQFTRTPSLAPLAGPPRSQ